MNTIELKSNFHTLIDSIQNKTMLSKFYDIISKAKESNDGELWNKLSNDEQAELIAIEKDSKEDKNLIDHDVMKAKYSKWL